MVKALGALSVGRAGDGSAPAPPAPAGPGEAAPPAGDGLRTRFGTVLSAEQIRQRLDGFRGQWKAQVLRDDGAHFVLQMPTPPSFWQRWTGRRPGLQVVIRLASPPPQAPTTTEVQVEVRPHGCGREQSTELLRVVAPLLVENMRGYLQVNAKGRQQERLAWPYPLRVWPVHPDGRLGEEIECQGKDLSLNGIGFYLPGPLPPTARVRLRLPQTPQTPAMTVQARVVRAQGCGEGWHEVGAALLMS
jgi:hypothetical protein